MFNKNFPDVKSPEQMAFEGKVGEIITGDEIDLDDPSVADYVTSDEDEQDDETMIEILEEMDFLASDAKKGKRLKAKKKILNVERKRIRKQKNLRRLRRLMIKEMEGRTFLKKSVKWMKLIERQWEPSF